MTMYCYKKCSTCKKASAFLKSRGVSFEEVDYTEQPISADALRSYWQRSGMALKKLFNTSGLLYRELNIKDKLSGMSENEQITLLASHPMLVKRPILVTASTVLIGFREAEWERAVNRWWQIQNRGRV